MKKHILLSILIILEMQFLANCSGGGEKEAADGRSDSYRRIISLSPSITETLFALGLGDRVAGVTRFCKYPPEARKLPQVGGYLDPNYEAIAVLKPDLVILRPESEEVSRYLEAMRVERLKVKNKNLEDILDCIRSIGQACGVAGRAKALIDSITASMDSIRDAVQGQPRPTVLISVGRPLGSGTIREVFGAAQGTLYDEMIALAGGKNVIQNSVADYPQLSAEGILSLNPDIIVELIPEEVAQNLKKAEIIGDWKSLSSANAVRANSIYIITGDYAVIPGPRFVLLLQDLARIFHPEINNSTIN